MDNSNQSPQRLAILVCCLLAAAGSRADESHGTLTVSAHVMAEARLEWLSASPTMAVSAADLVRGYAEVTQPAALRVSSNSRSGFALDLLPRGALFSSVSVHGLGDDISLGSEGGSVVQRWSGAGSTSLQLTFRFELAPGVAPGIYPLPLQLQVRPLEAGQ